MQSRIERERLLKLVGKEPVRSPLVLVQCAAGLAVMAVIAVIGLRAPINISAPSLSVATAKAAAGTRENMRAQPHRKQVFDERRVRFAGAAGRRSLASEAVEPANRLPLAPR